MLSPSLILSLREPAVIRNGGGNAVRVQLSNTTVTFKALPPRLKRALQRLRRGASDDELADLVGYEALASWYYCLSSLERRGAITYEVRQRERPVARMIVTSPFFQSGARPGPADRRWRLSRFAYIRRDGERLVLESPLSCAKVELLDRSAMAMLEALGRSSRARDAAARGVSKATARDFLSLLEHAGMLVPVNESGVSAEDVSPALQTWHFADLLFHGRSRAGRHDEPMETFRYLGKLPFLPAVKPPMSQETLDLHAPSLDERSRRGRSFTRVLESRRSVRAYDGRPISVTQLGEFLYRAARVKRIIEPDGKRVLYQASVRPYPGGGACYELEIYLAVGRCDGLAAGFYHYDPLNHRLEVIPGGAAHVPRFLQGTLASSAGPRQVLVVLAARFQRMSWKYNMSHYANILKNVGVLFQTMYLVATEMQLAPCALGGGNSELFARATGLPFHEESSVGEFMLGSRVSDSP